MDSHRSGTQAPLFYLTLAKERQEAGTWELELGLKSPLGARVLVGLHTMCETLQDWLGLVGVSPGIRQGNASLGPDRWQEPRLFPKTFVNQESIF